MIAKEFKTGAEAFREAKRIMAEGYPGGTGREWLESSPTDSYKSANYRVTVAVLEGSPPKAIVLYNRGNGIVRGFDCQGKNTLVFRFRGEI